MIPGKGKSLSNRLLSLLGIKYATTEGHGTTLMTEVEIASGSGLVLPGSLLARYQIQRLLGSGGYGSVFLARDIVIGRLVALKILNQGLAASEVIYSHFIQEARIAGQLDHENIVVIYNVEEHKDCACIVMEYLAEGNLLTRQEEEEGFFDLEEALEIIIGILEGVSVAHKMKVIHRDIKPENILFDPKGRAKISDFGIAHLPKDAGGVFGPGEYNPVGTPSYMAPEQLKGAKDIDCRADLYSVGAIFYELLTGRKVYKFPRDMNFKKIVEMMNEADYQSAGDLRPDLPENMLVIIDKLLNKNRDHRYSSANEVLNELLVIRKEHSSEKEADKRSEQLYTSPDALLEDVMRLLLVDGIMSPAERRELNKRAERLKVSPENARIIENRIRKEMKLPSLETLEEYQAAVTLMAGDGLLSAQEKQILKEASERLGIRDEERAMIEKDTLEKSLKGIRS